MNKDIMRAAGFGKEVDAIEAGKCPGCDELVDPEAFRNDISLREFRISGMCQKCQDKFFGED